MKERAGIQSVEVGFGLLQVLGEADGALMLRDLARAANMSAAKAHRYLVSFQRLQLVVQDAASTRYDLGPAALKLGLASLSRLDAVKLARGRIAQLVERIGHTLALAVWGNHGPTIVHWEESPSAVTVNLRLGDVMPLLTSATGLCFAPEAREAAGEFVGDAHEGCNRSQHAMPRDAMVCHRRRRERDRILREIIGIDFRHRRDRAPRPQPPRRRAPRRSPRPSGRRPRRVRAAARARSGRASRGRGARPASRAPPNRGS